MTVLGIVAILIAVGYALFGFVLWRCRINERRDYWAMRLHTSIFDTNDQEKP